MLVIEKITDILTPIALEYSLRIVEIEFAYKTLKISVEKPDYTSASIDECEKVSKAFSMILDVEDLIDDKYFLEVSSAGLARPLITLEDWVHFTGRNVKFELKNPRNEEDVRKQFKGKLISVDGNNITVEVKLDNEMQSLDFDFNNILKAKLLITEDFIREILKNDKQERKNKNV